MCRECYNAVFFVNTGTYSLRCSQKDIGIKMSCGVDLALQK